MEKVDVYTLPISSVFEMVDETKSQISTTKEFLVDLLQQQDKADDYFLLPLVVEILASNYSIQKLLEREVQNAVFHETEEGTSQDIILLKEVVGALSNLLISRYQANLELNALSRSISVH